MKKSKQLPISLKIAAGYLLISGLVGLAWPFLNLGLHHSEFQAQSFAFKVGAYVRQNLIELAFVVSAVGIFMYKAWARKAALVTLVIATIYDGSAFAWGFVQGKPGVQVQIISYAIISAWHALWFYLIHKPSSTEALS